MTETLNKLKTPPQSLEAEQGVIGSLLLGAQFDMVSACVSAEDFYQPQHRLLFAACGVLAGKDVKTDLITVSDCLDASKELEIAGGMAYLAELAKNTPSISNAFAYAQIVRDRAMQRHVISAGQQIAQLGFNGDILTADKIVEAQKIVLALDASDATEEVTNADEPIKALIHKIEERGNKKGYLGELSGFPDLDGFVKGFRSKRVFVLAGRPGSGKSTLATNIIEYVAGNGSPALIFSLEMTTEEVIERMVCSLGRVDGNAIDSGEMDNQWEKLTAGVHRVKLLPIRFCDKTGLTIGRIRAIARFQKKMHGIKFIVIDHIGLIRTPGKQNRNIELGEVSRQIKEMAKELDVDVLEICQLNRAIESRNDKTPNMSDLRDSGEIEQDADFIGIIHRPQEEQGGLTTLTVTKNRGGKLGKMTIVHKGQYSRFESYSGIDEPHQSNKKSWADKY